MGNVILLLKNRQGTRATARQWLTSDTVLLVYLALISFVGHMLVAGNYGYFRDELYYLEGGRHLAFGYVDFEPVIAVLSAITSTLFNDNLVAIHVIPALAGGCLVVVAGLMARELGGGRFAQALAAIATMFAVVFMATGSIFSMDVLDELWWTLCAYIVVRIIKHDQPRLWLLFGLVAGIGLMTKLTILFFGLALVIALLLTPGRRYFRMPWIWLGGAIAFVIFLPYLIWNTVNGWPTWEFWHHYSGLGNGSFDFFANQILLMNPLAVPLAIAGLYFYFRSKEGKLYRVLGWTFVIVYVLLTLIGAKPYFLPPAYAILFAGGALVFERLAQRQRWGWIKPTYLAALVVVGLLLAPLAMPVLPPATFVSNYGVLTGAGNGGAGQQTTGAFPQYLGDRFGWDTMTATMAQVYASLPASERVQACIFTDNYGEASAINFLGSKYHLPPAISGHNNYYLWGPGKCSGAVLITVDETQANMMQTYSSVTQAATVTCKYCMAYENDLPVYICTQPKGSALRGAWLRVKHFN